MILPSRSSEQLIGYYLLALALVTGMALVVPGLATSPLGIDEHVSYWIAGAENPGSLWERSLDYAATPPLSSCVQRTFLAIGGKSEFCFRLPSLIGFLCAIGFTFLFARDLLGPLPAGLAAHLLVWHPDALDRMRQARPYGLSVALAALLLWLTGRWCRSPGNIRLMLLWTCAAVAVAWTHYLNIPLVALVGLWLCGISIVRSDGQQRPGPLLLVAGGLFVVATMPLLPSIFRLQEWSSALSFRQAPPPLWRGIGPYWWLLLPVGSCAAWLLTRIIPDKGHSGRPILLPLRQHLPLLILLGCLPVVGFAIFAAGSIATLAEPRYRLVYAPASVVLLSGCLMQNRRLAAVLVASMIGVAGAWWSLGDRPWNSTELSVPAAADWTQLTRQLQKNGQPNEPVFVYSGLIEGRLVPALFGDRLFLDYVSCRAGRFIIETPHPRFALPWSWTWHAPMIAFYEQALREAQEHGINSIWLIASVDTDLGRESVERFTELVSTQRYRESERMVTTNAVLLKFEQNR